MRWCKASCSAPRPHTSSSISAPTSPTSSSIPGSAHERDLPDDQPWKRALRRLVHRRGAMVGASVVLFFVLVAIFAPVISPYTPIATDWGAVRKAPSWAHWLGTDEIGRDVLSRVIFGARASLKAGVISVLISLSL